MLRVIANYDEAESTETLDLYEVMEEDGVSIDFWLKKGSQPTSMDIHVEFERGDES